MVYIIHAAINIYLGMEVNVYKFIDIQLFPLSIYSFEVYLQYRFSMNTQPTISKINYNLNCN